MQRLFWGIFKSFLITISCRSSSFILLPILPKCCKNNCNSLGHQKISPAIYNFQNPPLACSFMCDHQMSTPSNQFNYHSQYEHKTNTGKPVLNGIEYRRNKLQL
jgi:hypothetical protein